MHQIYKAKHELWLEISFASFAIDDADIKSHLYDFSQIAFRHMKWLAEDILAQNGTYNYDRDLILYKRENLFEILTSLQESVKDIQKLYPENLLGERIKRDDAYLLEYLAQILNDRSNDAEITAFNMKREWKDKNLDQEQIDALTLFLFDESYKEYELILLYAYMQARTKNSLHFSIYQDLIDESHFHLKSFGNMMAKLGILALPRQLHERTYIVQDLEQFILDGIDEEEGAKVMCQELSAKITEKNLSQFFDFINSQESYHIELMKKLLKK